MKLTLKQKQLLVAVAENLEVNFSYTESFDDCAAEDDFFQIFNEDDMRAVFQGKSVSGIMSSLHKKGIFIDDCVWDTEWVKVRGCLTLKDVKIPLWRFTNKQVFADVYNINKGESVNDALDRMRQEIQQEAA